MTHRLTTNYAKNYCNRTLIVKVIVENVVTFFLGHSVEYLMRTSNGEKISMICLVVLIKYWECHGQTDRQTDRYTDKTAISIYV